jgi:hypothetical protein
VTATAIAWIITITLWAGILALVGVAALSRAFRRHHSHGRHPRPTEPPHRPPTTAARARRLLLLLVPRTLRGRTPEHEGATANWAPRAAVAAVGQAPELTTAPEQMVADHAALDGISQAIAHFDALIEAELDRFLAGMPLARMRLAASVEKTGEMPVLVVTG